MNLRAAQLLIELHDVVIQLNHLNVEVLDEHCRMICPCKTWKTSLVR
jgi:hypothetical protein